MAVDSPSIETEKMRTQVAVKVVGAREMVAVGVGIGSDDAVGAGVGE